MDALRLQLCVHGKNQLEWGLFGVGREGVGCDVKIVVQMLLVDCAGTTEARASVPHFDSASLF